MADRWAIAGVDLHLRPLGSRVRAGLEDALRDAVRDGRLAAGTRLPSSRALAGDLGLARNTVAEAYAQLVAEGWLVARQGSGTRVAERPRAATRTRAPSAKCSADPAVAAPHHDLRPGFPDVTSFPRAAWVSATRRALAAAPPAAFGYDCPEGRPELRSALAEYLARARGVVADPQRIVVCGGFAEALSLTCEALGARGARTLATERHGLDTHRRIAARSGLSTRPLEIDRHGARTDLLTRGADAALLTPAHQFPLGVALAPARRSAAIQWASDGRHTVVEDDYDGEFRYDRQPVGAMQSLAPDRVVYAGTASKSLAPGLRIAWLVLPDDLHRHVLEAQGLLRGGPDAVAQLALAELIRSGAYDRHVRRARLLYRRRRDRLLAMVQGQAPAVRVHGIAAGLHALLELPAGTSEREAVEHAASRGLALSGLEGFTDGPPTGWPALVIGYATPPEHGYTAALARLGAVLAAVS